MALYTVSTGQTVLAQDVNQVINVLTGTDTATQVVVGNRIRAQMAGATGASGYVGGTTSGAPTSGTFAAGDLVIDQQGCFWVCTTGGTPGTFKRIGPAGYTARVHQASSGSFPVSGGANPLFYVPTLDTTDYDPHSMWSGANNRLTAPFTATYLISGRVSVSVGSATRVAVVLLRNGTLQANEISRGFDGVTGSAGFGGGPIQDLYQLTAGDTIKLGLYVETAGSTETSSGARTFLSMTLWDQ